MDIPEIRSAVAPFLLRADLAAASLVCKSWSASFIPPLYSVIHWSMFSSQRPPSDEIVTHADQIRCLYLVVDQFEVLIENCTKVEFLHVGLIFRNPEAMNQLATLVKRNPGLKSIDIHVSDFVLPKDLLRAVSVIPALRKLQVHIHSMDEECMELLLNTAIRLEHLKFISFGTASLKSLDKWPCFPTMKCLECNFDKNMLIEFQLDMIRKCPQLRALSLNTIGHKQFPISDFCDILKTH
ncbi:hypothetical protein BGZ65_007645, partial [Modicella reniformis]